MITSDTVHRLAFGPVLPRRISLDVTQKEATRLYPGDRLDLGAFPGAPLRGGQVNAEDPVLWGLRVDPGGDHVRLTGANEIELLRWRSGNQRQKRESPHMRRPIQITRPTTCISSSTHSTGGIAGLSDISW